MMWPSSTAMILPMTLLVLVTGCSAKSSTMTPSAGTTGGSVAASPAAANLTGTWRGYVGVGARSTTLLMNLQQEGQDLKGDLAVGGRADLSGGVTGKVTGDTVRLSLQTGATAPQLQVKGDTMTGVISGEPLTAQRVR